MSEMYMEKVIGHLNDCVEASRRDNTWVFVRKDIVEDAIAMLKERDTGSVGIRQTSDSIEFTASGDAEHGFALGIKLGKVMMLEYIWKNCLWGNVMTDGVLEILKTARKEISYE